MPDLLIFLLIFCAVLLVCNGMNDAFLIQQSESAYSRLRSNWGVVKFLIALATMIWAVYATWEGGV